MDFEVPPGSQTWTDWHATIAEKIGDQGHLTPLGPRHIAGFVGKGTTLLVSFESHQGIQILSPRRHPLGWDMTYSFGWSHLGVISNGDTWFRDPSVYAYFDQLVDDGFFDGFDTVLFYGAGPCGYAAAAFSVAAPGARVLVVQPQATLDPMVTGWDRRFTNMRRSCFTDRYGYAPDMLDAASDTFVLYDPTQTEDAMHAALFTRPGVTKLRLRHMGSALQVDLMQMEVLQNLIVAAGHGQLTPTRFAHLMRARRDHLPYLRRVLARLDQVAHQRLTETFCRAVVARHKAPRFARRLAQLTQDTSG